MKNLQKALFIGIIFIIASCATVDTDRSYSLSGGDTFEIRLDSNPSTGYQWQIVEGLSGSCLELIDETYEPAANTSGQERVGGGGTQVWRMKAACKEKTVLKLVYKRSWENEPVKVKYFKVSVK